MTHLDMRALKYFFFVLISLVMTSLVMVSLVMGSFVISSSNAWADLALPMAAGNSASITEIQDVLLTGDSILLIGFVLWIAYIVFCFPKDTLKQ
jgi:hypothetical protein